MPQITKNDDGSVHFAPNYENKLIQDDALTNKTREYMKHETMWRNLQRTETSVPALFATQGGCYPFMSEDDKDNFVYGGYFKYPSGWWRIQETRNRDNELIRRVEEHVDYEQKKRPS